MKKAFYMLVFVVAALLAVVGAKAYHAEQAQATAESIEVLSDAATGAIEKADVIDVVEDKIEGLFND